MEAKQINKLNPFYTPSEPIELYSGKNKIGILEDKWNGKWCLWEDRAGGKLLLCSDIWLEMLSLLNNYQ